MIKTCKIKTCKIKTCGWLSSVGCYCFGGRGVRTVGQRSGGTVGFAQPAPPNVPADLRPAHAPAARGAEVKVKVKVKV